MVNQLFSLSGRILLPESIINENIYLCIENGKLNKVKQFVSDGYDVNCIDFGRRPLVTACSYMKHDIVKFLIEAGADVNLKDGCGTGPLYMACSQKNTSLETISLLVSSGGDINSICGQYLFSTLLSACQHSRIEIVEYLIKMGADINHVNKLGNTPIKVAMMFGNMDMSAKLLLSGADTSVLGPEEICAIKKLISDDNWNRRRVILMTRNSLDMVENPIIGGSIDIFKHMVSYI